ncbi:Histidine protein methyltransferase 1 [Rhizoclosmatium sp. JEL0117]|nr:Histidine protein methyltransferase 1 [Rhizoclosmatium sp. JEL0117]
MSFRFNFGNTDEPEQPEQTISTVELPKEVIGECIRLTPTLLLYRRCLADVKLDVAQDQSESEWVDKVMLDNTDLIDGVYEGGFKTWECSLDLAEYLSAEFTEDWFVGKRTLELGCGSALPGVYCLSRGAYVDFQDYNELVIKLVTMPNTLLNSFARPAAEIIDERGAFEVDVDLAQIQNLQCGFFCGDWGSLNVDGTEQYDLILTSETIYSTESHLRLHNVLKRSLKRDGNVLIAAKKTYFGCSGDLQQFMMLVQREGVFKSEVVREFTSGVHRVIVKLSFV